MGVPGLLLGILAWTTLSEPRRGRAQAPFQQRQETSAVSPKLKDVCLTLWSIVSFRQILWAIALLFFFNFGIGQWMPTYLIRSFGLSTGELGTWLAIVYSISGIAGAYLGGEWASRRAANNERVQLIGSAVAILVCCLSMVLVFLSSSLTAALVALGIAAGTSAAVYGPVFAILQSLVPESMRAVSVALIYLFANLVGMGVGPLATGILSDSLRALLGEESLRYALLVLTPGFLPIAWCLYRASRVVAADLRHSERKSDEAHRQSVPVPSALST
jgi:MFS family permease